MTSWERRIRRAEELAHEHAASAELLRFYTVISRFQSRMAADFSKLREPPAALSLHPAQLPAPVRGYAWDLLRLIQRAGPSVLSRKADQLMRSDHWDPADPSARFAARVLVQPYAEQLAAGADIPSGSQEASCPFCREKPAVAVLRPEGDGGKRSLVCSLCATEWGYRRLLCPQCGEESQEKLPVYTANEFPHIRIEACDTCRMYLKSIDLTRNGLAVPQVDELAAVPLDIWAAGHEYVKLQPNLLGL